MPRTCYLDADRISYLESIQALQQPTLDIPFYLSKKDTESGLKFKETLNTALCNQSLPMVNELEKCAPA